LSGWVGHMIRATEYRTNRRAHLQKLTVNDLLTRLMKLMQDDKNEYATVSMGISHRTLHKRDLVERILDIEFPISSGSEQG
jgi:hypothetical protein